MIKSEILNTTGMVWPLSCDKWKAPKHKDDYADKIFSTLSSARVLAEKPDSRRHYTTSFRENVEVTETSFQMLEFQSFGDQKRD